MNVSNHLVRKSFYLITFTFNILSMIIPREAEGYSVELFGLYVRRLSVCPTLGGVHCVTVAATPITAQLWFIHFWKAQVT